VRLQTVACCYGYEPGTAAIQFELKVSPGHRGLLRSLSTALRGTHRTREPGKRWHLKRQATPRLARSWLSSSQARHGLERRFQAKAPPWGKGDFLVEKRRGLNLRLRKWVCGGRRRFNRKLTIAGSGPRLCRQTGPQQRPHDPRARHGWFDPSKGLRGLNLAAGGRALIGY